MDKRICKVLVNDVWKIISFRLLKEGNIFRLTEPTGEPVRDNLGKTVFMATSDAYLVITSFPHNWGIICEGAE